ncbi:hypothetical protein [Tropicimonas sp. S265A]|uniref:hypothetical protein n=1 Tax=Tropicimonas sp. S265A TaxID=3415134 RepID=UPI003C7DD4DA
MPTLTIRGTIIPESVLSNHPAFQPDGQTRFDFPNGFGEGDHYALEVDPANPVAMKFEPGTTTEVWYLTTEGRGWSRQDIVDAEPGLSSTSQVTNAWLNGQDLYGKRSSHPLEWDVAGGAGPGRSIYTSKMNETQSDTKFVAYWWMFERGGTYQFDTRVVSGECLLHPVVHGAFGSGPKPKLAEAPQRSLGDPRPYYNAYSGLEMPGYAMQAGAYGTLFSDVLLSEHETVVNAAPSEYITWFGTNVWDVHVKSPGGTNWSGGDRASGIFFGSGASHVLMWNVFLDLNGWQIGYDPVNADGSLPQAPNDKNHNVYCTENVSDVTFIESISTRASHNSVQLRGGGFLGPSVHGENNAGSFHGRAGSSYQTDSTIKFQKDDIVTGQSSGAMSPPMLGGTTYQYAFRVRPPLTADQTQFQIGETVTASVSGATGEILSVTEFGNYGATLDVLTMGAGFRPGNLIGVRTKAFNGLEHLDAVHANLIIANGVDPQNPEEISAKSGFFTNGELGITLVGSDQDQVDKSHYTGTIKAYNWGPSSNDKDIAGLDTSTLNEVTFGGWADAHQSQPIGTSTAFEAIDYLRTLPDAAARFQDIWNFAATRFDMPTFGHGPGTIIFDPATYCPWAEGYRGDNPHNWRIDGKRDFPVDGDNLVLKSLVGWYRTVRAADIAFENGAVARVSGGYMSCTTTHGAGGLDVRGAGQFEFKGTSSAVLDATVTGGRISVSGTIDGGLSANVFNDARFVVYQGGSVTFGADDTLTLNGDAARVGFDGQGGTAAVIFGSGSTLAFIAGDAGVSTIREFRSGHYGLEEFGGGVTGQPRDPNLTSQVTLEAGAVVSVDTTGLAPGTYTLIDVDSLTDNGAILPAGVSVIGNRLEVSV